MNVTDIPIWLQLLIVTLAAYRITRFLVVDSLVGMGPDSGSGLSFYVDRFAYDEDGKDRSWWRGKLGDLVSCTWCTGAWVSLAVFSLWVGQSPLSFTVQEWLTVWAVAGLQGYLNSRMNA